MRTIGNRRSRDSSGYVALLTAMAIVVLFGMAAFAVDVGNWYVTTKRVQRAADAGALAGVPSLPGNPQGAYDIAREYTAVNGYDDAEADTEVVTGLDGQPTRLRVTVSSTVENVFGTLLGIPTTTITRSAVADYAGPVPMGSPCNAYGDDPDPNGTRGKSCDKVTGQFWANVGGPMSPKSTGDAFQDSVCAIGVDGCAGTTNVDYDENGYFYSVTLPKPVSNLKLEVFDPAMVHVGDYCSQNLLDADKAQNPYTPLKSNIRYASGLGEYCTGDQRFGGTGEVATQFTVRAPGPNPWDPLSFPVQTSCGTSTTPRTFPGFNGPLFEALDEKDNGGKPNPKYNSYVASVFRQWVNICTIPYAPAGTYMIQVKTNGVGNDAASGHNRFSLRAYGNGSNANDISIAGYTKMAMYANQPGAKTGFYLARVPSGAAGQVLNLKLFDIGDSSQPGLVTVVAPEDSNVTFTNCQGRGVVNGLLSSCSIVANSTFNGKWQTISVNIPSTYKCDDTDSTGCWVRLNYDYGTGAQPADTTSWQASVEGDPVRLVE